MSPRTRMSAVVILLGLIGLSACVTVIAVLVRPDVPEVEVTTVTSSPPDTRPVIPPGAPAPFDASPVIVPAAKPPVPPSITVGPRRLPVGGVPGHFVVIEPDGSSYLEDPTGKKTVLMEKGPALVPAPVPNKSADPPPPRQVTGQLIVCDVGVVEVPKGAIITFIGRDKVVTHDGAGGSATYYIDGRVDARAARTEVGTRKP